MAVGRPAAWVVDLLRDRTPGAAGHVVDVARPRQRCLPARPRSAESPLAARPWTKPVRDEIGTLRAVGDLILVPVHHRIALLHAVVRREREEQSVAAPQ